MNRIAFALIGTAVATLALTGCGSSIQKDASYSDVLGLRDAYVATGAVADPKCDSKVTEDGKAQWGWQTVNCGMNTVLLVADSQSGLDQQVTTSVKYAASRESILVGANWMIRGPEFEVKAVQAKLGGQLKN
ncbi:hypothetical protein OOZ51_04960 [Arthrobacter sp. MI7-26]|uniref:hypothetical protein n=1 Tax=Arthrobacter sp. MI7-26 TaxID=2993653 RepID=UPI002248DF74|nr:hypothetical protein [Arthrobacter sp. MI7-26]MCX2747164.1 hypothetical protein [Arthrobacter sp. MI7-26]